MSNALELSLDEVQPGMALAAAVVDRNGQVLLPAGLTLAENHIESLRRRGIERLSIAQPEAPDAKARQREAMRARVMHIFRHTADDPAAQPLLHAVLAFREEQLK
ncbi:MAG: hypothetical protein L6Q69_10560 [Zoogloea sp.]|jgi:hypothetical protein|nr:hypothetical protein [Zoogloea sp.]